MPEDMVRTENAAHIPEQATEAVGIGNKLGSWFFNKGQQRPGMMAAILRFIGEKMLQRFGDKQQQDLIKQINLIKKNKSYDPETKAKMIESLQKGVDGIEALKTMTPRDAGVSTVELSPNARNFDPKVIEQPPEMLEINKSAVLLQQDFNKAYEELNKQQLTDAQRKNIGDAKTQFDTAKGQIADLQGRMNSVDRYGRTELAKQAGAKLELMRGAKESLGDVAKKLKIRLDISKQA